MDFTHILADTYTIVLFVVAVSFFVYLVVYYGLVFLRLGIYKPKQGADESAAAGALPPVSVVITSTNDVEMLRSHLLFLLEQEYFDNEGNPNFEVIVVDYLSTDDTQFVLRLCSAKYPHLKVVRMPSDVNHFHGKKYPLSLGIRVAKNDLIVLTDPECMPTTGAWLSSIAKAYVRNSGTKIVLGYSNLKHENNMLGWLQQYDNLNYNSKFISAALMHFPYTGCGRNLAYSRKFFFDNNAFISNYQEPDGADDMFVHQNSNKQNTCVLLDSESFVDVSQFPSFYAWHKYRRHRMATQKYYRVGHKLRLLLYPLGVALFYAACIMMFFAPSMPWLVPALLLLLKVGWQIICFYIVEKRFSLPKIYGVAPLFELYFLVANTILPITPLYRKSKHH